MSIWLWLALAWISPTLFILVGLLWYSYRERRAKREDAYLELAEEKQRTEGNELAFEDA